MKVEKILCPMDFSEPSDQALRYAAFIAKSHSADLYVMYVKESHTSANRHTLDYEQIKDKLKKAYEKHFNYFVIAKNPGLQFNSEVRQGKASSEILSVAKQKSIDLIVMGSHGQTGLDHATIGSVAEKVLRKAACPVLLVKSKSD